ncbi:nuclear pore complex protein NUP98A-like isoform X1 [Vitis riparia]|uniref:nuclear pore complex protein NUP98A-like isoform X1 n=1 Tax=Vitis riparia TaxID=96939 RepID=UPI00155B11F5|nr:nuclear pore complex protein NUP98A-like isoform X1 [Vitis riparia]
MCICLHGHGAPYILPSTYMWGSSTNGSGLTGCATQSSSPLGSTSTTAAAGSPSFGVGSSSFSHVGRFRHPQTAYNPRRVTLTINKGPHITSSTFGSTVFGRPAISDERRGSRIAPYATKAEVDGASFEQPAGS